MASLTVRLNRISPKLCRFLARKRLGRLPMSYRDIARRSGLSKTRVIQISKLDRWDDLPVRVVEAFSLACGVNLLKPDVHLRRRRLVDYPAKGNLAQRRMYDRLMRELTSGNVRTHDEEKDADVRLRA